MKIIEGNEEYEVPQMITISKAAALCDLSYACVRRMCIENKIIYIKTGTKFLINKKRFINYLNGNADQGEN